MGTLLNSGEQRLFDSIAIEVLTLAGTHSPVLWKFSKTGNPATADSSSGVSGLVDCLYEEPRIPNTLDPKSKLKLYTPYKVLCFFERPATVVDARDEGLQERSEGKFWFSRRNLEDLKIPTNHLGEHVAVGDVIQLWSQVKNRSWYFEFINVERDGFEHDAEVWTHYECEGVRNDSFAPERKIAP